MKIEVNPEYDAMGERVIAYCKGLSRGDILPHEVIDRATDAPRHSVRWTQIKLRVERWLRQERGIAIWAVTDVGYRLLTVEDQLIELPKWRMLKSKRQINRGIREVAALPDGALNMHQRLIKDARLERLRRKRRELGATLREQLVIARPSETMPRPRKV